MRTMVELTIPKNYKDEPVFYELIKKFKNRTNMTQKKTKNILHDKHDVNVSISTIRTIWNEA